jgi:hypothetical protein
MFSAGLLINPNMPRLQFPATHPPAILLANDRINRPAEQHPSLWQRAIMKRELSRAPVE